MFLADVLVAIVSSRYPSKPYVLSTNPCNRMLINIFVIHMCCTVVPEKKQGSYGKSPVRLTVNRPVETSMRRWFFLLRWAYILITC
jgi:hypothetical protein